MDAVNTVEHTASPDGKNETEPSDRAPDSGAGEPMLVEELLVEEVSIDGMCGVY